MKPGTYVRMSFDLKKRLIANGSVDHVAEFGNCIGLVEGLVDYNNVPKHDPTYDPTKVGPEVDVRWLPSKLRYAYRTDDLYPVHCT